MNDISIPEFKRIIFGRHGCGSTLLRGELVQERYLDEVVWQGEVLVFQLHGHSNAIRCYAWEASGEVLTVLETPPVDSATEAVRRAILEGRETARPPW